MLIKFSKANCRTIVSYNNVLIHTCIYLPKDSPLFDDPESLRYFDTVTVSNTADLLNSIQNNRKILLEAGEYDFSQVASKAINNFRVSESWDGTKNVISEVSSLCIEAKDGAKVELCIDEPYDPVISFNNSKGITLRNLTVRHHVEPGYCSGSVLCFEGVDHLNVDKCNLYGSGTYGIEAYNTYDANVTDTDIYECTYGLVALHNVGTFNFKNCVMRDSSDLSMIDCDSAYDVTFEDCVFSGNDATSFDTTSFVEVGGNLVVGGLKGGCGWDIVGLHAAGGHEGEGYEKNDIKFFPHVDSLTGRCLP